MHTPLAIHIALLSPIDYTILLEKAMVRILLLLHLMPAYLKTKCKNLSDSTTTVAMDPGSSLSFDTHYYKILLEYEGRLFQSDAALLTDKRSFEEVKKLLSIKYFLEKFAYSMKKMGEIQVLTGTEGQIRKKCSVVN